MGIICLRISCIYGLFDFHRYIHSNYFVKLYVIKGLLGFPVQMYYQEVFVRIILVTIVAFIIPSILYLLMDSSVFRLVVISGLNVLSTLLCIFLFGLEHSERTIVINKVQLLIKKSINKLWNNIIPMNEMFRY